MKQSYVAYFRVSTQKQGRSGLGLDAQRTAVSAYVASRGEVVAQFTDIESGKKAERPQLLDAIQFCKRNQAILLIAKLDRLTRNIAFIFALRDSSVEFVCADMPEANTLTIGIMATMAQHEREVISDRTRKALAEKKRRGTPLGNPENLTKSAILKSQRVRQNNARQNENNRRAGILAQSLRRAGNNWTQIANTLNDYGFVTRRGKLFQAIQVQRVIKLIETQMNFQS